MGARKERVIASRPRIGDGRRAPLNENRRTTVIGRVAFYGDRYGFLFRCATAAETLLTGDRLTGLDNEKFGDAPIHGRRAWDTGSIGARFFVSRTNTT